MITERRSANTMLFVVQIQTGMHAIPNALREWRVNDFHSTSGRGIVRLQKSQYFGSVSRQKTLRSVISIL